MPCARALPQRVLASRYPAHPFGWGRGDGGRMPSRDTDLFGQCCRPFSADVAAASANTSPDDRRVSTSELAPLGTPPLDGRLPGAAFSPPPPFSRISPSAQWASGNCATSAVHLWRASRTGLREPICNQSLVSCTFQVLAGSCTGFGNQILLFVGHLGSEMHFTIVLHKCPGIRMLHLIREMRIFANIRL